MLGQAYPADTKTLDKQEHGLEPRLLRIKIHERATALDPTHGIAITRGETAHDTDLLVQRRFRGRPAYSGVVQVNHMNFPLGRPCSK